MIKKINNELRDRYYNRLQETRIKAWNKSTVDNWMNILSKHGEIILDDDLLQSLYKKDAEKNTNETNETDKTDETNESNETKSVPYNLSNKFNSNAFNDKVLNKKFKGLKKLYDFYGTKSFQSPYEIIMNKNTCKNGKRAHMSRLVYKQNDSSSEDEDNKRELCPTLLGKVSDSESEIRQSHAYARSEASEDLIENNHEMQTESLNPSNPKRISPQEPTSSIDQANKNIMNK